MEHVKPLFREGGHMVPWVGDAARKPARWENVHAVSLLLERT